MTSLRTAMCRVMTWAVLLATCDAVAGVPAWRVDPARSTLDFVATQLGAEFEGRFRRFDAQIVFAPEDLTGSRFEVTVEPGSADTQEAQRDEALRGPELFDVARFATARFVTTAFRRTGTGRYEATGRLTLRDVTRDVTIAFSFTRHAQGASAWAELIGSARLRRLDFGVGRGDFADTEALGNDVQVRFHLRLLPAAPSPGATRP